MNSCPRPKSWARAARTSSPSTTRWLPKRTTADTTVPSCPARRRSQTSVIPVSHWCSKRATSHGPRPKMRDSLAAVPPSTRSPTYSARRSAGVLRSMEDTSVAIWRRYQARAQLVGHPGILEVADGGRAEQRGHHLLPHQEVEPVLQALHGGAEEGKGHPLDHEDGADGAEGDPGHRPGQPALLEDGVEEGTDGHGS